MFLNDIPTESLIDLRVHMIRLSSTADLTPTQSRNLLTALAIIDCELCRRCTGEPCLAPEPRSIDCKYKVVLKSA